MCETQRESEEKTSVVCDVIKVLNHGSELGLSTWANCTTFQCVSVWYKANSNNLLHNMHTNHSNSSFKFRAVGHKLWRVHYQLCYLSLWVSLDTLDTSTSLSAPDMIIKIFHAALPIFPFLLVIKRASPNWRDPVSNARPLLLEKGISAWLCMYTGGSGCTAQGEYYRRNG